MNVSRETSVKIEPQFSHLTKRTNADSVFEMWLLTRDPAKVAQESFYHEAHRVAMQAHEQRKSGADADIRSLPKRRGRPSYDEVRRRFLNNR